MIWLLLLGLFIASLFLIKSETRCPREVLGYQCKGQTCDHSDEAQADAERLLFERRIAVTDIRRNR